MKQEIPIYDISSLSSLRKEELIVGRFGSYSRSHQHLHYPHRHSFYHIVLFTEGSGSHSIDFEQFEVKPGQIYFMVPGQVHSWSFKGPVDGFVVNFSATYFQSFLLHTDYLQKFSFFNSVVKDSVLDLPAGACKAVADLFEELLNITTQSTKFSDDHGRVLLLRMFMVISDLLVEKSEKYLSSYNYTLLRNFQQLIERNYENLRLPKDYAELLYITPNHLNALCNDLLGLSAGEVIRNRIVLEAKRLLVNLDLSVTEISYQLNFNDNSYFTKFFKKYVGVTPEEFRKTFKK
ncbi:AraC family transcriptional regulator [Pedobacter sp. SYSU D00535]|uniref:AraC family transcriptional regulator n=1 Tax=Pedobacter sp. SYSU D00535 TaxID=2810308 RepID=UPI001A95D585|nr:AraC family transcriptional regulator [Pedobacter sp. SYSU D00535]